MSKHLKETQMRPTKKVGAAGAGGALGVIVAWALSQFAGVDVTAEAAAAMSTVLSFVVAYLVPER